MTVVDNDDIQWRNAMTYKPLSAISIIEPAYMSPLTSLQTEDATLQTIHVEVQPDPSHAISRVMVYASPAVSCRLWRAELHLEGEAKPVTKEVNGAYSVVASFKIDYMPSKIVEVTISIGGPAPAPDPLYAPGTYGAQRKRTTGNA